METMEFEVSIEHLFQFKSTDPVKLRDKSELPAISLTKSTVGFLLRDL